MRHCTAIRSTLLAASLAVLGMVGVGKMRQKANEAVLTGTRIEITPEMLAI